MSDYNRLDDDTHTVIADGIEQIAKFTRRLRSKIGLIETRDSPALRKQIEDDHRKGQEIISETKAELRGARNNPQIRQIEQEFRTACASFRDAFAEYKNNSSGAVFYSDDNAANDFSRQENASQQSLTQLIESEDVDAIMERENREDTLRLAQDTAVIRDTMLDVNELIVEGGQALIDIEGEVEDAVEAAEQAETELKKAREHQKKVMKLKIAIGVCCGVVILVALFITLWKLGVFNKSGGSTPSPSPSPSSNFTVAMP